MMKTLIFDIETCALTSELYHEDMAYLRKRGNTDKTEEKVLEELSLNPYLSNVVAAALIEIDEDSINSVQSLRSKAWYLTESEEENNTVGSITYMGGNHEIEYIPIKLNEFSVEEIKRRERDLLKGFYSKISNADRIVSYNGKRFDNQFLFIRALYHDLDIPEFIRDRRVQDAKHIDIMEFLSRGYSESKYSLDFVSRHMGFKSPKMKYEGSMVRELFRDGKYKEIARYCALDTIVLTYMYRKFRKYMYPQTIERQMITERQLEYCAEIAKNLLNLSNCNDEIKALFVNLDRDTTSSVIEILKGLVDIQNKRQNKGHNGKQEFSLKKTFKPHLKEENGR
ncbi:MAG: ribonuclease H-like domain-containing protein [Thermoplasmata archaeon]